MIWLPQLVMKDSGWNWMPWRGAVLCEIAIISFSLVQASRVKSSGTRSRINE